MQRLYYSISEVCSILNEEQYTLRYWEKEFGILNPKKNRGGNRIYSEKDLFVAKVIKRLLRDEKLSLKGAKEQIHSIIESITENGTLFPLENISDSDNRQSIKIKKRILDQTNSGIKLSSQQAKGLYHLLEKMLNSLSVV
ncbi:MAG: MerR family transcriptional regulator [Ignavibacteria bacterium]|nr:MerR family transcriptional regulator [Ignavibacteria bacterium]